MSTERDTLIELAKRENENNHNQNTNDSIGGVDSAIEQENSPYSDDPEITVNQPQFTEKTPQGNDIRVPNNYSESNLSTETENSQNNLSSTETDHDEATRIKSYQFPSFSNLIPRSNESNQTEQDLVPSTENNLTPNQNSSFESE